MGLEKLRAEFQFVGQPDIILIAERDEFALAESQGSGKVPRDSEIGGLLVEVDRERCGAPELSDDGGGVIGRTVIGDDEFRRQKSLPGQAA